MESALSVPDAELGLVSLDEFAEFAQRRRGRGRCELIEGEIRTMPPASGPHGDVAMEIGAQLRNFVKERKLGKAYAAETGFRLPDPDNPEARPSVRAPDACFIAADRTGIAGKKGFVQTPPDLAVEVHSPDDRVGEIAEKTRWWLTRGVREVWNVDPASETITILLPDGSARLFHRGEAATSPTVLPGFEVGLADLFDG